MPRRNDARRSSSAVSPTLRAFGNQVRHYRDKLGLSQDRLGERVYVSGTYIGQVELGQTRCTEEFAGSLDRVFGANDALVRLWSDLVQHVAYPVWFDWPTVERDAAMLQAFELSVVYGLLQTPEYAAALLNDETAVAARLSRQSILAKEDPPMVAVLMDESALYRRIGDAKIMADQLQHVASAQSRRLTVQIVPAELHDGLAGSFVLATMADRSEVAYVDTAVRGMTTSGRAELARLAEALSSLRANAYSVRESTELLHRTAVERWT
jgi:transcriptional regulator with XRE-family HTH domain